MENEVKQFTGKNVEEALTNALIELGTTSDKIDYEVIEKESAGILGIGKKPAVIAVKLNKSTIKKKVLSWFTWTMLQLHPCGKKQ